MTSSALTRSRSCTWTSQGFACLRLHTSRVNETAGVYVAADSIRVWSALRVSPLARDGEISSEPDRAGHPSQGSVATGWRLTNQGRRVFSYYSVLSDQPKQALVASCCACGPDLKTNLNSSRRRAENNHLARGPGRLGHWARAAAAPAQGQLRAFPRIMIIMIINGPMTQIICSHLSPAR